jgi:BlaI family penicillinase repressor
MKQEQIAASVSNAEMDILQELWLRSPLSAQDIIERLSERQPPVHPTAVRTLISRLLKKEALSFIEQHRKYLYSPTISRDEFYRQRTTSFMDRFFDGELSPLISYFSREKALKEKDLADLKALIGQMENGHDK